MVAGAHAHAPEVPGHDPRALAAPHLGHERRVARRARRRHDGGELGGVDGQHPAVGVVPLVAEAAQRVLVDERDLGPQVLEATDVRGPEADGVPRLADQGRGFVGVGQELDAGVRPAAPRWRAGPSSRPPRRRRCSHRPRGAAGVAAPAEGLVEGGVVHRAGRGAGQGVDELDRPGLLVRGQVGPAVPDEVLGGRPRRPGGGRPPPSRSGPRSGRARRSRRRRRRPGASAGSPRSRRDRCSRPRT